MEERTMDVIEKFGNRVSSQALKDPEKARRLLLADVYKRQLHTFFAIQRCFFIFLLFPLCLIIRKKIQLLIHFFFLYRIFIHKPVRRDIDSSDKQVSVNDSVI